MKKSEYFAIIIFLVGLISNIIIQNTFPTYAPLLMTKTQAFIEMVSLGLIVSGVVLIFRVFIISKFSRKESEHEDKL